MDKTSKGIVKALLAAAVAMPLRADYIPADPMRFTADEWMNRPGLMSEGGVPNRTTVCKTLSPSGGDDTSAIQSAVDGCASGQVVFLSAGTYIVNSLVMIGKSITLRGAGPRATVLKKTNGAQPGQEAILGPASSIIEVSPLNHQYAWPDNNTSQNLTADGNKGDASITVANASGYAAGQFVLIDELSGASWQPDRTVPGGLVWASPDYRVMWNAHKPPLPDSYDDMDPDAGQMDALGWFNRGDRPTCEYHQVASVSGNTITFTSPLHISYRVSHGAQVTRHASDSLHVTHAGVEDLGMVGGSDDALSFVTAAYCWARNVEVSVWSGVGVHFLNCFRCELRDSFVHDAAWSSPGGGAYAIGMDNGSSEILIENNISVRTDKVMVARCAGAGSVAGYNYMDDGYINWTGSEYFIESGINGSHMVGPHHILFEGNYSFNWDSDATHGNAIYHTVFRNQFRGLRSPFVHQLTGKLIDDDATASAGPKACIRSSFYSEWMTFVGNVLGKQGKMSGWAYSAKNWDNPAIWMLGFVKTYYDQGTVDSDVRDGNWDWMQAKQSWHNSSPVAIQNSLYLPGKPAFFGSNPWPWVHPETGAVDTLPAMARFSALENGDSMPPARPKGFRLH